MTQPLPVDRPLDAVPGESIRQFCSRTLDLYPPEKIEAAIEFLQTQWQDNPAVEEVRKEIAKDPENWATPFHFGWGMAVRNLLRKGGFGEQYWPIWNLDDIYIPLVERALKL